MPDKHPDRVRAENYKMSDGKAGKDAIKEFSDDIEAIMMDLRKFLKRIDETKDMLHKQQAKSCLTELLNAIGSLQDGYSEVIFNQIKTHKTKDQVKIESIDVTIENPIKFEDRVKRIKGAIEQARSTLSTVGTINEGKDFIPALILRIKMIFSPSTGSVAKLIEKLDNFQKQLSREKTDIPIRFFLPKPPEPNYLRNEAKQHEAKSHSNKKRS